MLKFTLVKGKIVLDPNIVLFKELHDIYKSKDGNKYLQVIYYLHSREPDNPFRDIDKRMIEENVLRAVFNVSDWKELNMSPKQNKMYENASAIFQKYNTTPESRLESTIDFKLDEITKLIRDTKPVIEQNEVASGETKFNTNLTIILNMFSKVESIMKSKNILQTAIRKQEGATRVRGGGTTSFREMGVLKKK